MNLLKNRILGVIESLGYDETPATRSDDSSRKMTWVFTFKGDAKDPAHWLSLFMSSDKHAQIVLCFGKRPGEPGITEKTFTLDVSFGQGVGLYYDLRTNISVSHEHLSLFTQFLTKVYSSLDGLQLKANPAPSPIIASSHLSLLGE